MLVFKAFSLICHHSVALRAFIFSLNPSLKDKLFNDGSNREDKGKLRPGGQIRPPGLSNLAHETLMLIDIKRPNVL